MSDKQKVTLYLPPDLHRKLRIQSALDGDAMSAIAERAIGFYFEHSELVESVDQYGETHQVHNCPSCATSVVLKDSQLIPVSSQACVLADDSLELRSDSVKRLTENVQSPEDEDGATHGELVPC